MNMKRKRRKSSDRIEAMAFINAITRFRRFVQYLLKIICLLLFQYLGCYISFQLVIRKLIKFSSVVTYLVTLNTLNNLRALSADNPNLFDLSWKFTQNTSNIDPRITMVSNLKYIKCLLLISSFYIKTTFNIYIY